MTDPSSIVIKKFPVLKFTIVIMVVIGVLFPCIFAFINHQTNLPALVKDIIITTIVEITTAMIVYCIIIIVNHLLKPDINRWWRYPAEMLIVLIIDFYLLYALFSLTRELQSTPGQLLATAGFRLYIIVNLAGTMGVYMLVTSLNLYQLMLEKSAQSEKLQREYSQISLYCLKSQVNPHFLFNSLSVLSTLVHVSPETSEKFIVQLAKAYRYILEQKDAELVTLKEELDFLDAYFFLLQIRFEKKILLEKNIGVAAGEWQLPPLCLQLLVENAVKHNKMSFAVPLVIRISTLNDWITVENNSNLREREGNSTGIGLENIRKRMAYATDKQVGIVKDKNIFRVSLPLIKK